MEVTMVTRQYSPPPTLLSLCLCCVCVSVRWACMTEGGGAYTTHPQVSIETDMLTRFLSESNISSSLSQRSLRRPWTGWGVKLDCCWCWSIWFLAAFQGKSLDLSRNHVSQRNWRESEKMSLRREILLWTKVAVLCVCVFFFFQKINRNTQIQDFKLPPLSLC